MFRFSPLHTSTPYASRSPSPSNASRSVISMNPNDTAQRKELQTEMKNLKPTVFHESKVYCQTCPPREPYFLRQRPIPRPPKLGDFDFTCRVRQSNAPNDTGFFTGTHLSPFLRRNRSLLAFERHEQRLQDDSTAATRSPVSGYGGSITG